MKAEFVTELIDRLARLVANASHAEGLKPAQWEALRYLAVANRFSRTPGTLALWLGSTKGTVSQTINSLENRDLLTKETAVDRRSVHLTLTLKGRGLLSRDGLAQIHAGLEEMEIDEQAQLGVLLEGLLRRLISANRGRSFGVCHTCRHFMPLAKSKTEHFCSMLKVPLEEHEALQICVEQEAA